MNTRLICRVRDVMKTEFDLIDLIATIDPDAIQSFVLA